MRFDCMDADGKVLASGNITGMRFTAAHHGFVNDDERMVPCIAAGIPTHFGLYDLMGKQRVRGVIARRVFVCPGVLLVFHAGDLEIHLGEITDAVHGFPA